MENEAEIARFNLISRRLNFILAACNTPQFQFFNGKFFSNEIDFSYIFENSI